MRTFKLQLHFISWALICLDILLLVVQFIRIYLKPDERMQWRISLVLAGMILYNALTASLFNLWAQVALNSVLLFFVFRLAIRRNGVNVPDQKGESGLAVVEVDDDPDNIFLLNCRKDQLSAREIEVVRLLAKGMTYKEIADALHISVSTVDSHAQNSYKKAGVNNKIALLHKFTTKPGN